MEKHKYKYMFVLLVVSVATLFLVSGSALMYEGPSAELIEHAQAEGVVVVYSATSRIAAAAEAFQAKYNIRVEYSQLGDGEMIAKVTRENIADVAGADFVLAQDGGRVFGELIQPGYLENYIPDSLADIIPDTYQTPMVFQFCTKLFVYNSENAEESPITNVWALTDPEWQGRLHLKDPFQEGVNANFFTMVTSPSLAAELEKAYKNHYGVEIELTTPNAGYEWIKGIFANGVVLGTSDTRISEAVGAKGQSEQLIGLFTFNKVGPGNQDKNLALAPAMDLEPFSGFYYPMYALINSKAANPNAAKLFIEFLLTDEGFGPWIHTTGDYSPNPTVPIPDGDYPLSFWDEILVREDPEWTFQNRAEVEDFLNSYMY